jgi:DNA repair protein RecO (recombination protein O)
MKSDARARSPALLLERYPYGESSLVVHLLTPAHGRVHALAKGCYRPGAASYCALDLFDTLEVDFAPRQGGGLATLRSARVLRRRAGLAFDLERYRCALAHVELVAIAAREGHEETGLYATLERALERLLDPRCDPAVERIVFDLAFLQNLGLAPALEACATCGRAAAARAGSSWSRAAGGVLCERCAGEARRAGRALETPAPAVLAIARALSPPAASPTTRSTTARTGAPAPPPTRQGTPSIKMQPAQSSAVRAFVESFLFHHLEQAPRSRRARAAGLLLLACACLLPAGCGAGGRRSKELQPEQAVARMAEVEAAAPGRSALATFYDLAELWSTANLPPETRVALDERLEQTLALALPGLTAASADEETLGELFELDLPRRLRARLAVARARVLLAQGERKDAWRQIRELDELYRVHEERAAAGALVAEAGLSMARDPGVYFGVFRYRDAAVELLEDLVLHYPAEPRCVEAYMELASILAEQHEYARAIERLEELVVYFPDAPEVREAELRIPKLRLDQVGEAQKDRGGLVRARGEIAQWKQRHAEELARAAALAERVRALEQRAVRMVVDSDLSIAAYYRRIAQPTGQRLHAERALAVAEANQDTERAERARALLPKQPASDGQPATSAPAPAGK